MSKRFNRVIGACMAALLVVVLSGAALAIVRPTLTLHASSPSHRALHMAGRYFPHNPRTCGLENRKVLFYVDGNLKPAFTRTDALGRYSFTRLISSGLHEVQTRVKGRILGVHPHIRRCADAWSNAVTVNVR